MLNKIREKSGFVSIETIIVTGVVIALGLYGMTQYNDVGKLAIDAGVDKLADALLLEIPTP